MWRNAANAVRARSCGLDAERRLGGFSTQELANTAWAFAKVGQSAVALFVALAQIAESCVRTFDTQMLANTA